MKVADIKSEDIIAAGNESKTINRGMSALWCLQKKYPEYPEKILLRAIQREDRKGTICIAVSIRNWYVM